MTSNPASVGREEIDRRAREMFAVARPGIAWDGHGVNRSYWRRKATAASADHIGEPNNMVPASVGPAPDGEGPDEDRLHDAIRQLRQHSATIQAAKRASAAGKPQGVEPVWNLINALPGIVRQLDAAELEIEAAFERYEDRAPHPDREAEPTGGVVETVARLIEPNAWMAKDVNPDWQVIALTRRITAPKAVEQSLKKAAEILSALSVSPPVVEGALGSSAEGADTQPGASLTVLARLAEAEGELQRLRDAEWSEMSDAELGRCFKAFAASVETHSKAEWRGDAEMRLGLMNMGLMQAIKMAAESNAETFTYRAAGFHSEGVQHGDWIVTFARQQAAVSDDAQPGIFALRENEPKARHQPTTPGEQGEEG